jgi:hypothetical protein
MDDSKERSTDGPTFHDSTVCLSEPAMMPAKAPIEANIVKIKTIAGHGV